MKFRYWIIVWILCFMMGRFAVEMFAAERTEVKVFIPKTGQDSSRAESLEKEVRAVSLLMGQITISNSKGVWLGYVTDADSLLKDTLELKRLIRSASKNVKLDVRKIEKLELDNPFKR